MQTIHNKTPVEMFFIRTILKNRKEILKISKTIYIEENNVTHMILVVCQQDVNINGMDYILNLKGHVKKKPAKFTKNMQ